MFTGISDVDRVVGAIGPFRSRLGNVFNERERSINNSAHWPAAGRYHGTCRQRQPDSFRRQIPDGGWGGELGGIC